MFATSLVSSGLRVRLPAEGASNVGKDNIPYVSFFARYVKPWAPCVGISGYVKELPAGKNYPQSLVWSLMVTVALLR